MKKIKIVYVPLAVDILHTGHLNIINTAKKYVENIEKDSNPILIKKLQENWKKIGHAGKYAEQKLWKKFRTQCDAFFEGKNKIY